MLKTITFAGLAAALLFGAIPAHAGIALNGMQLNGLWLNGLQLNGLQLNGLQLNGVQINGNADGTAAPAIRSLTLPSGSTFIVR